MANNINLKFKYDDAPTMARFAMSDAFIRLAKGPFGSSKSSACTFEMVRRAMVQPKSKRDGLRHSRWAIIRNSYRQLLDTTIKTVHNWLPPNVVGTWKATDHDFIIDQLPGIHLELNFRALDRPDQVSNLLSAEYTGAWFNEIREIPKEILDAMTGRVYRFPSKDDCGDYWSGIIGDTNPPDTDHYLYKMFEEPVYEDVVIPCNKVTCRHEFNLKENNGVCPKCGCPYQEAFHQPSGRSPQAENLKNLSKGYYQRLMIGKDPDFIKVYVDGQYGYTRDGKPVFPNYNDSVHVAKEELKGNKAFPLIIGIDFGLDVSAVICQTDARGRFYILEELLSDGMGIRQFTANVLKPALIDRYKGYRIGIIGDPAGQTRSQTDESTCYDELKKAGLPAEPAPTNALIPRLEAVNALLTRTVEGGAAFLICPVKCRTVRKGFNGGYRFRRIQSSGDARYTDVPEKNSYSHCLVGDTKVTTLTGETQIKDIQVGDLVRTPIGYKRVTATMNRPVEECVSVLLSTGEKIDCTPEHPFVIVEGLGRADSLKPNDMLSGIDQKVKVTGIERYKCPNTLVYDLTVEDAHVFYANGVLVGNCMDAVQYAALYSEGEVKSILEDRARFVTPQQMPPTID